MKKITFIIMILSISRISFADIYVLSDQATGEVYSLSSQNDAVVPGGIVAVKIPGNLESLQLSYQHKDYLFKNGQLIPNIKKIEDREKRRQKALKKSLEFSDIDNQARKMAYESLKQSGKNFEEVKDEDFEKGGP